MPGIGRPQDLNQRNPFNNVTIRKPPVNAKNQKKLSKGDILNKVAGKDEMIDTGAKFVDGKKHGKLGKDGFLKLLTHQLQNQDPFKPMDQNKFAADLAQFSQLEQMTNMNKNLEATLGDDAMKQKFYAASFIGKKVVTGGATIKVDSLTDRLTLTFKLPDQIDRGMLRIYDQKNQMIQQLDVEAMPKGIHSVSWDGNQMDGTKAGKGMYRFEVLGYDEMSNRVPIETQAVGTVTSVEFDGAEPVLTVDGKKVYLRDVKSFHVAELNGVVQNEMKRHAK